MRNAVATSIAAALLAVTLISAPGSAPTAAAAKIPITKLADLPPHSYKIPDKPSALLTNKAAILDLANAVEKDMKADLEKYDIQDQTATRRMYGTLLTIAMLKEDNPAARQLVATVRDLQEKPAQKLTSGLLAEAIMKTRESGAADPHAALRSNLEQSLKALPYQEVQEVLKSNKGSFEGTAWIPPSRTERSARIWRADWSKQATWWPISSRSRTISWRPIRPSSTPTRRSRRPISGRLAT